MLRLLKIGGSLITVKEKPYTVHWERLRDVVNGIVRARGRFMIGHGGGSFPHTSAKKYRTKEGFVDERSPLGLGVVHRDATALNQIFVEELHKMGVPAMSFHPSSFMVAKNDDLALFFPDPLFHALEKGLLPIFYGDAILDIEKGSTIYSTETIIRHLALHAREMGERVSIGMAELVDGVYTADPLKHEDAELIERIDRNNYEEVFSYIGGSHGVDVTGGMKHKVESLLELAKIGIDSYIFQGTGENIRKFLSGEKVKGTVITW